MSRNIKACSSSPDIKSLLPRNESVLLSRHRMAKKRPKKERREGETDRMTADSSLDEFSPERSQARSSFQRSFRISRRILDNLGDYRAADDRDAKRATFYIEARTRFRGIRPSVRSARVAAHGQFSARAIARRKISGRCESPASNYVYSPCDRLTTPLEKEEESAGEMVLAAANAAIAVPARRRTRRRCSSVERNSARSNRMDPKNEETTESNSGERKERERERGGERVAEHRVNCYGVNCRPRFDRHHGGRSHASPAIGIT